MSIDEDYEPIPPVPWALVKKCTRMQWCSGMHMALSGVPENSEAKGLSVSRGWLGDQAADERPKLIGVTYHAKARGQGLVLNFCPWCGNSIRFAEAGAPKNRGGDER